MYSNAVNKMLETVEKLSRLTTLRGATPAEAATAQRKIKIIQAKLAILNTPKPDIPRHKPTATRWVWKTKDEHVYAKPTLDPTPEARVFVERHRADCCCGRHPDEYVSFNYVWETRDGGRTWNHILKQKPAAPTSPPAATAKPAKPTPPPEQTIFPNYADLQNRYRV